ncbi:MAG: histidine phosphatase family protein [Propionibacteriaceae bacterium]|nr:histidine phosphatase family protein [Propionibacteriaceae bacterium]
MADSKPARHINAAGAVVVRHGTTGPEVLLVQPAEADGWVLPHGKLGPDEYVAVCAVRQTHEQTGVRIRLGLPLGGTAPRAGHGPATVSYWSGRAVTEAEPLPGPGVGKVAWLSGAGALRLVAGAGERDLIRLALELPDTVPVLIVRHGKAMQRSHWSGRDQARPLTSRGRRQSQRLAGLLEAYGVTRLVSSTSNRCMKTLQPHAKAHRLEVVGWTTLSEEQAENNLRAVDKLIRRLIAETVTTVEPMAICGHRPVLPTMLAPFDISSRTLHPATALVAHLTLDGETVAVEHHPPRA